MRDITPRNNNGSLLLRFTYADKRYNFNPLPGAKYDDNIAYKTACGIAERIRLDCITGNFDPTLAKYKPQQVKSSINDVLNSTVKHPKVNAVNLMKLFEEYISFKRKNLSENTLNTDYKTARNKLEKCPYKLVNESGKILGWLRDDCNGKNNASVKKTWMLINSCCKWAVSLEKLQSNPFEKMGCALNELDGGSSKKDAFPFTSTERDMIIASFQNHKSFSHYAPLVEFLFFTGCRPSEALALQWKHIKGNEIIFCQTLTSKRNIEDGTKTQDRRKITMNSRVASVVERIKPESFTPDDYVFKGKRGTHINWTYFSEDIWQRVLKGLPDIEYRSAYHTRHTAITQMIKNEMDAVVVGKLVGNSAGTISRHYAGDMSDREMKSL